MRLMKEIRADMQIAEDEHRYTAALRYNEELRHAIDETEAWWHTLPMERKQELCLAEQENRCVVLPEPEESDYDGLKVKYRVFKAGNHEPVENGFVLRPDKDPVARTALAMYAQHCGNEQLKLDLISWLQQIAKAALGGIGMNEQRLIDANALLKNSFEVETKEYGRIFVVGIDAIEEAPAIDAAPVVHGKWIRTAKGLRVKRCSSCKSEWYLPKGKPPNYCPTCGADMRGEHENTDGN